jgi:hypothetical protein
MIRRVIFLCDSKFSQRDYQRFGFDIIQKRGYKVEVWDYTHWLNPNYAKNYICPDLCDYQGIKYLKTIEEIQLAIRSLSEEDVVIDNYGLISKIRHNLLSRCIVGALMTESQPTLRKNRFSRIIIKFKKNPLEAFLYLIKRLKNKIKPLTSIDFVIYGGTASKSQNANTSKKTTFIKAHSCDYDRFLEESFISNEAFVSDKSPYAIFLDEAFPVSHDLFYLGEKPYPGHKEYYLEINRFFKNFQEKTGLNIIIAAHPKWNYKLKKNPFNVGQIIPGKTVSLVKHSTIVLAHGSRSINYAILYKKNALLIDSETYTEDQRRHIQNMSNATGSKLINVASDIEFDIYDIKYDKEKYISYKKKYIKDNNTPDRFVMETFCDYIDSANSYSTSQVSQ